MSLWKVDDDATQLLMASFYRNYLNGMSKREALLAAQQKVKSTPGFEDPYYWAAFILLDALN
jgi:CHAT domain-containing protein